MPDWKGFLSDPQFVALPDDQKVAATQAMIARDPEMSALQPGEQQEVIRRLYTMHNRATPTGEGPYAPPQPVEPPPQVDPLQAVADTVAAQSPLAFQNPIQQIEQNQRLGKMADKAQGYSGITDWLAKIAEQKSTLAPNLPFPANVAVEALSAITGAQPPSVGDIPGLRELRRSGILGSVENTAGPLSGVAQALMGGANRGIDMVKGVLEGRDALGNAVNEKLGLESTEGADTKIWKAVEDTVSKITGKATQALNEERMAFGAAFRQSVQERLGPQFDKDFEDTKGASELADYMGRMFPAAVQSSAPIVALQSIPGLGQAAAGALVLGYSIDELQQGVLSETGKTLSPEEAGLRAVPSAAIEFVGDKLIAKGVAPKTAKSWLNWAGNRALGFFETTAPEVAEEMLQQVAYILNMKDVKGDDPLKWSPEDWKAVKEAGWGALFGMAPIGVVGAANIRQPEAAHMQQKLDEHMIEIAQQVRKVRTDPQKAGEQGVIIPQPMPVVEAGEARWRESEQLMPYLEDDDRAALARDELDLEALSRKTGRPVNVLESDVQRVKEAAEKTQGMQKLTPAAPTPEGGDVVKEIQNALLEDARIKAEEGDIENADDMRAAAQEIKIVEPSNDMLKSAQGYAKAHFGGAQLLFFHARRGRTRGVMVRPGLIAVEVGPHVASEPFIILGSMAHELTHNLKGTAPDAYEHVVNVAKTKFPQFWKRATAKFQQELPGAELDDEEIMARLLELPDMIRNLIQASANPTVAERLAKEPGGYKRFVEWAGDIIRKVANAIGLTKKLPQGRQKGSLVEQSRMNWLLQNPKEMRNEAQLVMELLKASEVVPSGATRTPQGEVVPSAVQETEEEVSTPAAEEQAPLPPTAVQEPAPQPVSDIAPPAEEETPTTPPPQPPQGAPSAKRKKKNGGYYERANAATTVEEVDAIDKEVQADAKLTDDERDAIFDALNIREEEIRSGKSKAAPERLLAAEMEPDKPIAINTEKGQIEVTKLSEGGYRVKMRSPGGKTLANRKVNTLREAKAVIKSLGGPKYSMSLDESMTTEQLAPQSKLTIHRWRMITIGEKLKGLPKSTIEAALNDIEILEKREYTPDEKLISALGEHLGVQVVIAVPGPIARPYIRTYGLHWVQGAVLVVRPNEPYTTVQLAMHEILHNITRRMDGEQKKAFYKELRKKNEVQWAVAEALVKDVYGDSISTDHLNDEIVSEIIEYYPQEIVSSILATSISFNQSAKEGMIQALEDIAEGMKKLGATEKAWEWIKKWSNIDHLDPDSLETFIKALDSFAGAPYLASPKPEHLEMLKNMQILEGKPYQSYPGGVAPKFSVASIELWEESYRAEAKKRGASQEEIDKNVAGIRYSGLVMMAKPQLLPVHDESSLGGGDVGPLRQNQDYHFTSDLDTICARNMSWDQYRSAVEMSIARPLNKVEKVALMLHLKSEGITVPCGYCYVESARENFVAQTVRFLGAVEQSQHLALTTKKTPSVIAKEVWGASASNHQKELTAQWVRDARNGKPLLPTSLRLLVDESFKAKWVKRDKRTQTMLDEAYASAQGAAKSKPRQTYYQYTDQIWKLPEAKVREINDRAGLRFFSSTDFKMGHVVDLMQIITDASARGLKAHAYTKVVEFAEIFGGTGMKIGMSTAATTKDGKVVENTEGGVAWKDAQRLRKKYKDVGVVMVVTDDTQLEWALEQDWVDLIIPWHASGLPYWVGRGLEGWKDYTKYQHDSGTPDGKNYKFKDHGNDLAKLKEIAQRDGATLRFHNVVLPSGKRATEHPNYMKLVTDNVRIDSEQQVIKPEFDMEAFERIAGQWEPSAKVDQGVIDTFVSDKIGDAAALEEAGKELAAQNKARQNKEAKAGVKQKEFTELVQLDTRSSRVNVPPLVNKSLSVATVERAAQLVTDEGSATFTEVNKTDMKIIKQHFGSVRETPSGKVVASEPKRPKYATSVNEDDGTRMIEEVSSMQENGAEFDPETERDPTWNLPEVLGWNALRKKIQDSFIQFKRLNQLLRDEGFDITEGMDVYLAEELYHGKTAEQAERIYQKYVMPALTALRSLAKAKGLEYDKILADFDDYLHAMHSTERNRHLKEIWVNRKRKSLTDVVELLRKRVAQLKAEQELAEGPMHKERVGKQIKSLDARIVKAQRLLDEINEMEKSGKIPHSGMLESKRDAVMSQLRKAGLVGEFSRIAKQYVYKMLDERLDNLLREGLLTKKVYDEVKKEYEYYVPLKGLQERPGDVEEILDEYHDYGSGRGFDIRGDELHLSLGREKEGKVSKIFAQAVADSLRASDRIERNRVGLAFLELAENMPNKHLWEINKRVKKKIFDRSTGTAQYVDATWFHQKDPNVVAVKRNGEEYYITIKDAGLATAMAGLGTENTGKVLRKMRALMRGLSHLYTTLNPEFVLTNFARDLQQAKISLTTDQGKELADHIGRNSFKAALGIMAANFPDRFGRYKNEYTTAFHELKEQGGKVSFWALRSIDELHKDMLNDLKRHSNAWHTTRHGLHTLGRWITATNESTENAIRLATYVQAKKIGLSTKQAASLAKNVTVNFNRKGDAAGLMGGLYLFANAGVQGVQRMGKSLAGPTGRKIAAKLVMAGYTTALIARVGMGKDDDDEWYYDKISDFDKRRHWIIPGTNGNYLRIPLPYGFGFFVQLGQELESIMFGGGDLGERASRGFARTLSGLTTHVSPIGETNFNGSFYSVMRPFIPSLLAPFTDAAMNESYWGPPIYPQTAPWDKSSKSARYYRPTSMRDKVLIAATGGLNRLFQGHEFKSSGPLTDWNPGVIGYVIDAFTGPAFAFWGRTGELPRKLARDDWKANDVPLARRFWGQAAPEYYIPSEFYDAANDIASAAQKYEQMVKKEQDTTKFEERYSNELRMAKAAERVQEVIRKIKTAAGDEYTKETQQQVLDTMKEFLSEYHSKD